MLVEPSAQVPLLRSPQRNPSIRDIVWATTGSAEEDWPLLGEGNTPGRWHVNTSRDSQESTQSKRHKHSKGGGGQCPLTRALVQAFRQEEQLADRVWSSSSSVVPIRGGGLGQGLRGVLVGTRRPALLRPLQWSQG